MAAKTVKAKYQGKTAWTYKMNNGMLAFVSAQRKKVEKNAPKKKFCPKCERTLAVSAFGVRTHKDETGKPNRFSLQSYCTECRSAKSAKKTPKKAAAKKTVKAKKVAVKKVKLSATKKGKKAAAKKNETVVAPVTVPVETPAPAIDNLVVAPAAPAVTEPVTDTLEPLPSIEELTTVEVPAATAAPATGEKRPRKFQIVDA